MASNPETLAVVLDGEIDLHEAPRIRELLLPALAREVDRLVIDLSAVTYIDSSGLALLIEALQRVTSYGGDLALSGLRPSLKSIFEIARLDQVFQIVPDQDSSASG